VEGFVVVVECRDNKVKTLFPHSHHAVQAGMLLLSLVPPVFLVYKQASWLLLFALFVIGQKVLVSPTVLLHSGTPTRSFLLLLRGLLLHLNL
jgi:hypothetical protein